MEPPLGCDTLDSTDSAKCGTCSAGYTKLLDETCFNCTTIDDSCTDCEVAGQCKTCDGGLPSGDKLSCVPDSPNCSMVNGGDNTLCDDCNANFTLNTDT